mgnify:FL=1
MVICDLAEFYGIHDYKKHKPTHIAMLVVGLRNNSRCKMHLSGTTVELDTYLQAGILDRLSFLAWAQTKDGAKNTNRPKQIVEILSKGMNKKETHARTSEEYEETRAIYIKQITSERGASE